MAPMASGSNPGDAMAICPCTMGTLGAIANGLADNLIERAADVMLKERRPLVLVPRETPLSAIHLENMLKLARAGAVILPPAPGFYTHPQTVADLVDFVVARVLDHLAVPHALLPRWGDAARPMIESPRKRPRAVDTAAVSAAHRAVSRRPAAAQGLRAALHRHDEGCLRDERPFGVCMITQGDEVAQPDGTTPQFASVGTLARITDLDMPQLGILHVQTEGDHALRGAQQHRRCHGARPSAK